jgi:hypothetical protein
MPLITLEQIAAPFITGGWEDRTVDRDEPRFRRRISDDIAIQTGLRPIAKGRSVRFAPTVGAQHAETGRLVAEFLGLPPSAGENLSSTGVVLADVLYTRGVALTASRERWQITSPQQGDAVAEQVYKDVVEYGVPELSAIRSLDDLIERLHGQRRHQIQSGHLAVACGLAGRQPQAESALREFAEPAQEQEGPLLEQTRGFVTRFVEHFGFGAQ